MKLTCIAQLYNELEKDNLPRFLESVSRYCDALIIYDDASTDDSVEYIMNWNDYNPIKIYLIQGKENNFSNEIAHKQQMLEKAIEIESDWIFWLDCVTGDTIVPVRYKDSGIVDILTLEEMWNIKNIIRIDKNGKEYKECKNLQALSLTKVHDNTFIMNKFSRNDRLDSIFLNLLTNKERQVIENFYNGAVVTSINHRINKKLKKLKAYTTEWKDIKYISRKETDKNIIRVQNKYGEISATEDHLVGSFKNNLEYIKLSDATEFCQITKIDLPRNNNIDLKDFLTNPRFYFDENFVYFDSLRGKNIGFNRYFKKEELFDFCELLGFFCAEGSTTCKDFRISENNKDLLIHYMNILERLSCNTNNYIAISSVNRKNTNYYLGCTSSVIINIFRELCGAGSKNKKVPNFIFSLSNDMISNFLKGYNLGDGHLRRGNSQSSTTISRKLVGGISVICKILNKQVSLTTKKTITNNTAYNICQNISYRKQYGKTKIENIEDKVVYDLTISETHNFISAIGCVVIHNCDEIIEARGENGGIRALCENPDVDAYGFKEVNLWRSPYFYRLDNAYNDGEFSRLWRNTGKLYYDCKPGLHQRQYPQGVHDIVTSDIKVIHYGFSSDDRIVDKYVTYKAHGQTGWALNRLVDERTLAVAVSRPEWFRVPPKQEEFSEVFKTPIAQRVV